MVWPVAFCLSVQTLIYTKLFVCKRAYKWTPRSCVLIFTTLLTFHCLAQYWSYAIGFKDDKRISIFTLIWQHVPIFPSLLSFTIPFTLYCCSPPILFFFNTHLFIRARASYFAFVCIISSFFARACSSLTLTVLSGPITLLVQARYRELSKLHLHTINVLCDFF